MPSTKWVTWLVRQNVQTGVKGHSKLADPHTSDTESHQVSCWFVLVALLDDKTTSLKAKNMSTECSVTSHGSQSGFWF